MIGRGKSKQGCSKRLSQRFKEDRISQLPDPLIFQILSHLSTKNSVKTSVLSTRWKSLWLWVPSLDLDSEEVRDSQYRKDLSSFVSFGDRFFDSNRVSVSCLEKVNLAIFNGNNVDASASHFTSWVYASVKRKVQHLRVRFPADVEKYVIPINLYTCETLVYLKLTMLTLPDAKFFTLPCLKTMLLTYILFPNETTFERLVSSCRVLKELKIEEHVNSHGKMYRVFSRSLKSLTLKIRFSLQDPDSGIVIDAPRLSFLSIKENLSESVIVTNMDSSVKVNLSLGKYIVSEEADVLSQRNRLRNFLTQISKVRDMNIYLDTFKLLWECSKLEALPQFGYMSRLQVALSYPYSKWLPTFLERFPNLKSLILVCHNYYEHLPTEEMNQYGFSSVPECLLSSLEFVDFMIPLSGLAWEMKLVRYLLEQSVILKKLTLYVKYDASVYDIFKELLIIPRGSAKCEVDVRDWKDIEHCEFMCNILEVD